LIRIFKHHSSAGTIFLAIYVDDIVITGDDNQGIIQLKTYLSSHFYMKDFGLLRYFLGIKVTLSERSFTVSKKDLTGLLEETSKDLNH